MVERWTNQRFDDHLCPRPPGCDSVSRLYTYHVTTLRMRTEMVLETLLCSPFNHSSRLITRKNFTVITRRESVRSHFSEADHSPPSSTEVKNAWSYTPPPPYAFMTCCFTSPYSFITLTRGWYNWHSVQSQCQRTQSNQLHEAESYFRSWQ